MHYVVVRRPQSSVLPVMSSPTEPWRPLTRAELLDMLRLVEFFIRRGKTDTALKQIEYLVDAVELDVALDQLAACRKFGVAEHYLCQ